MEADQSVREEHTAASEASLLRALFDRLPALIAYCGRDQRLVLANATYSAWFGIPAEQMRGIHIRDVIGAEVYAANLPYFERALAGEQLTFDREVLDKTGQQVRHTQATYVPDVVDGEVQGVFVLVTDVTQRVDAQRAMDEAQSLARLGSWSLDVATGRITWSAELYRIFGVDPEEFVPTVESLRARVHPDDAARIAGLRRRVMESAEEYSAEYRICLPDRSVREIQSRGRPEVDASGTVVRLTGTIQDVTEANEAARELARVNAELVQLNALNADVIGMLGHDVRSPLAVVLGYLEELDDGWAATSDDVRRARVATARAAAVRLSALVDDILALASVESGEIIPEPAAHDLAPLVDEAMAAVSGHQSVSVEGDADLRVWCDAFHVRQVVVNLVSNALRYGDPPVLVSLVAGEDSASVVVRDHGPGVPAEFAPHLFERFARGPRQARARARGSGLGLYIARRLAEANGGTLTYARGERGGGAVFTLSLPRMG